MPIEIRFKKKYKGGDDPLLCITDLFLTRFTNMLCNEFFTT